MKTAYAIMTVTALSTSLVASADAGIINYSFITDATTVSVGDTVNITVHAQIDPQDDPFVALAGASFDIHVNDPIAGGGVINNASPDYGLAPDFASSGNQGTLSGSSIVGVFAFQFPPFMGPVNSDTELDLYTFSYTVTEADPREIVLNLSAVESQVYGFDIPPLQYDSASSPLTLQVTSAPAPGALALLGAAGLVGIRRRKS